MLQLHIIETAEISYASFCKGSNLFIRTLYLLLNCLLNSPSTDTITLCIMALTVNLGGHHLVQRNPNSWHGDMMSSINVLCYIGSCPESYLSVSKHFEFWGSEIKIRKYSEFVCRILWNHEPTLQHWIFSYSGLMVWLWQELAYTYFSLFPSPFLTLALWHTWNQLASNKTSIVGFLWFPTAASLKKKNINMIVL